MPEETLLSELHLVNLKHGKIRSSLFLSSNSLLNRVLNDLLLMRSEILVSTGNSNLLPDGRMSLSVPILAAINQISIREQLKLGLISEVKASYHNFPEITFNFQLKKAYKILLFRYF